MLRWLDFLTLLALLVHLTWASNYDSYITRLMDDGQRLHRNFIETNPNAQSILDRLSSSNSPRTSSSSALIHHNEFDPDSFSDSEWTEFLQNWLDSKRQLSDEPYSDRTLRGSESPLTYLPNEQDLPETELALRRNEVAYQNQLWGEHKVSGGSGEIGQWLDYALLGAGAQDNETADSTAATATTGLDGLYVLGGSPGLHSGGDHDQIKMDNLPAYCDPPNPCPLNYDPDLLSTPCDRGIENTIEFNREWIRQKMASGECSCDSEHMVSCPAPQNSVFGENVYGQGLKFGGKTLTSNPYLRGQKRKRLVAKKRVKRSWRSYYNPYLIGKPHRSAVKKAGNYPALPNHAM